jgi:hypothetical protein
MGTPIQMKRIACIKWNRTMTLMCNIWFETHRNIEFHMDEIQRLHKDYVFAYVPMFLCGDKKVNNGQNVRSVRVESGENS